MTKYNDTFTMIVCSATHLKTSYCELLAAVMHLIFCSCHATLYCTLLYLSFVEILVLCNPWHTWSSFFLPSRSSILNLVYLCHFISSISDFWSCSSPLSLLSNAIGLTQFGFFKKELCLISHNSLIMDCFSRAHLYSVPCVTVSSFGSEIYREKSAYCALYATFYGIPIR